MKKNTRYFLIAALGFAPLLLAASPASADDFCREYTKTIRIGGTYEQGVGTACLQPDGSWEMVSQRGNVDMYDHVYEALQREEPRVVLVHQTYERPSYRRHRHHHRHGYWHARHWPPGHYKHKHYNKHGKAHYSSRNDRDHHGHKKHRRDDHGRHRDRHYSHRDSGGYVYFKF